MLITAVYQSLFLLDHLVAGWSSHLATSLGCGDHLVAGWSSHLATGWVAWGDHLVTGWSSHLATGWVGAIILSLAGVVILLHVCAVNLTAPHSLMLVSLGTSLCDDVRSNGSRTLSFYSLKLCDLEMCSCNKDLNF